MRLVIPNDLRYRVVEYLESSPSALSAALVRFLVLIMLLVMGAPWSVGREISYGSRGCSLDLKSAVRSMFWIWNRSWLPFKFQLGTFFDIGWRLSPESCHLLESRGFVSRDPLKECSDLAQFRLAEIRDFERSGNVGSLQQVDQEICTLVATVLNEASSWASAGEARREDTRTHSADSVSAEKKPEQRFDNTKTKSALLDFDDLCRRENQTYFLVSGTFLGVVRDGSFIGHDHDIDLGVFEEDFSQRFLSAVSASDHFSVNEEDYICVRHVRDGHVRFSQMDKPAVVRLAHNTGISIDVFIHFREPDLVWHGTSVHRWDNTVFDLANYSFLDRKFKGADNFDRYLCENYGPDWRVPKQKFNVNFDTPNLRFAGTANALVFFAWMISKSVAEQDRERVHKYIDLLISMGVASKYQDVITIS